MGGPLDGCVVVVACIKDGSGILAAEVLLRAGASVAMYNEGGTGDALADMRPAVAERVEALLTRYPGRTLLIGDNDRLFTHPQLTSEQGWEDIFAEVRDGLGAVDAVVLGQWSPFVDSAAIPEVLRVVSRHGGELVAFEPPVPGHDHVLRWTTRWAAEHGAAAPLVTVLRGPADTRLPGRAPRAVSGRRRPGPMAVWEVLAWSGWEGPLTVQAADRAAAGLRLSGADPLAGRMWHATFGGFTGIGVLVGDAAEARRAAPLAGGLSDYQITEVVRRRDIPLVHVRSPERDVGFVIELPVGRAHEDADLPPVDCMRLSFDEDTWTSCLPGERIIIDVPSGRLFVASPESLQQHVIDEVTIAVEPGRYVLELWDTSGFRLYRADLAAPGARSDYGHPAREGAWLG